MSGVGQMQQATGRDEHFGLPEDRSDEFDEQALERAIRANRRREFAQLADLNG